MMMREDEIKLLFCDLVELVSYLVIRDTVKVKLYKDKTKIMARPQINTVAFMNNSNPSQGIMLCLPSVHQKVSKGFIFKVFKSWGFIQGIEFRPARLHNYKKAFIMFAPNRWNNPIVSDMTPFLKVLVEGTAPQRIFYVAGKPWYWNVRISKISRDELMNGHSKSVIVNNEMTLVQPPPVLRRQTAVKLDSDFEANSESDSDNGKEQVRDRHQDAMRKRDNSGPDYGRRNRRVNKVKEMDTRTAFNNLDDSLHEFLRVVESKRTYESACKLAYQRRDELPESFEYPEDNAPEAVKRAFTRAVYRALGM